MTLGYDPTLAAQRVVIKTDVRSSESDRFEIGTCVTLDLAARDVLVTPRRVPIATPAWRPLPS